jgi:hypothetical protein
MSIITILLLVPTAAFPVVWLVVLAFITLARLFESFKLEVTYDKDAQEWVGIGKSFPGDGGVLG